MIKNIFLFIAISFCAFLIASKVYACDPLGCLFGGHKQDTLIIGEVISESEDLRNIKIIFVFPQNQIKSLRKEDQIAVTVSQTIVNLTDEESKTITVGKKYLMSLNKKDNFYVSAWGIYEIAGTTYANAQLVKNESIDDEALQIFINSGGAEKDFAFDYSGNKPVLIRNRENKIVNQTYLKNNIIWYGSIIGILGLIGILVFETRKKK